MILRDSILPMTLMDTFPVQKTPMISTSHDLCADTDYVSPVRGSNVDKCIVLINQSIVPTPWVTSLYMSMIVYIPSQEKRLEMKA